MFRRLPAFYKEKYSGGIEKKKTKQKTKTNNRLKGTHPGQTMTEICYNFQEDGGNGGFLDFAIKSFDFRIIVFYTSQAGKRFVEIRHLQVRLEYFEFHPYRLLKTKNKKQ